jgi:hypothetical protein
VGGTVSDDEIRAHVALLMAMCDDGKVRIEPTDPDDGVGVAWIRVSDAARIAASLLCGAAESEPRGAAVASETTAMWTRPNTSSGLFTALRRRGISFRGASK